VNPHRILVVEDEAIVAMDIESRLAGMGYTLAGRATSGEQGLLLATAERPDLILMDIRLQGEMDGIDTAREIHQRLRIPVIFLTAYSEDSTLERAKLAEPFGYILKPFDDRELKSTIEIALYKHRTEQELLRMNRLYAVLSHVNEAIIRIQSREELLQAVCRVVVNFGALDLAWVGELERESGRIKPVVWFGKGHEMVLQADFPANNRPEGQGNPSRALREGKPFICNACSTGDCLYPSDKTPSCFGIQSCSAFPLWFQGEVWGVMSLCVTTPGFFQTPEIELLGEVAADLSFALDKMEGDRQRRQAEQEKELTTAVLMLINSATDTRALLQTVLSRLKQWSGCEAVGLRLQEGEDFTYYETSGFPENFVRLENSLCIRDGQGRIMRDHTGTPLMECMCGNILQGRVDPSKPFFTNGGSFWSNCTTELLATTTEADRQSPTRNRCNGAGYESVALIPLRSRNRTFGLIQLNDKRPGQFTLERIALFERLGENIANFLGKVQLEERLKESEAKLRAIGDNLPDGYVYQYTRGTDGSPRFLYVSAGVRQIHGVAPEEVLRDANTLMQQVDPAQSQPLLAAEKESATGLTDFAIDLHLRRPDGDWRWLHVSARPHRRPDGQVIWDGVAIDITDQRGLEDQFHQAQKMESIGRLAGGVAHDFNNMLTVISGYTELALNDTERDDPRYASLLEIRNAARRSASLTRQLLAFARKQAATPVPLDMNDTIAGMLKMLRRLLGEDIELDWLPGHELWQVKIDPSQIDQVLANLAVNARDAIAGVGRITIRTENVVHDASFCAHHQGCIPGEHVVLTVSDTGSGMSREVLEHIFEPFFTTKEKDQGTGLGLATIYGIVKQNLGFITVDSEPGHGTTFMVHLPRLIAENNVVNATPRPAEPLPRGTETILLVEDEKAILELGKRCIERQGYRVLAANSPEEAIMLAEAHEGPIHLLITDIIMPQMDGKELADRLWERLPGLKCLFMSGYSADIIAKHGVLEEGIHFMEKPFTLREVALKVRQALDAKPPPLTKGGQGGFPPTEQMRQCGIHFHRIDSVGAHPYPFYRRRGKLPEPCCREGEGTGIAP